MTSLFYPFTKDIYILRKKLSLDETNKALSLKQKFDFGKERPEIYSLITLAEPIMDIASEVDIPMIEKHNLKLGDTVLVKETGDENLVKIFDELESLPKVNYVPGGSAENTMRVLGWCLNMEKYDRENFKITMIGSLGDDLYKEKIIKELEEFGVNPMFEVLEGDKTSRCCVCIYQKEKLFATQIRASKRLSENFIEQHMEEILAHKALFIEGYMVSNKFNICKKLCEHFIKDKKLIILSLSAVFIVKFHYDKLIELANDADIIAGNFEEAKEFAGGKTDDIEEIFINIFEKLKPKEDRLIVITDGPKGAYFGKYNYEEQRLDHYIRYFANKLKDEEIQDLNGAGDAFLGGFLSRYMKGESVHDCCKIGIEAATVSLKNIGCTFPKEKNILIDLEMED